MDYAGHPEPAQETVRERKDARGRASVRADVARHEDARALIRACVEDFDPLDILVNNAGVEDKMPFLETPPEIWEKVIGVNLTGPWLCAERRRSRSSRKVGRGGSSTSPRYTRTCPCRPTPRTAPPREAYAC